MTGAIAAAPIAIAAEDQGRANLYALLARLFADVPDAALLSALAASDPMIAEGPDTGLAVAWGELVAAAAVIPAEVAGQEYVDLFVGVGKCEVNLHASHYVAGFMMEKPLATLRSRLAAQGLGKRPEQPMLEDHLAALCETMRVLIGGQGSFRPVPLRDQQAFFDAEIAPWFERCCDATSRSSLANFYAKVSEFTRQFLRLESEAFRVG